MRKRISVAIVLVMAMVVLIGCGGGAGWKSVSAVSPKVVAQPKPEFNLENLLKESNYAFKGVIQSINEYEVTDSNDKVNYYTVYQVEVELQMYPVSDTPETNIKLVCPTGSNYVSELSVDLKEGMRCFFMVHKFTDEDKANDPLKLTAHGNYLLPNDAFNSFIVLEGARVQLYSGYPFIDYYVKGQEGTSKGEIVTVMFQSDFERAFHKLVNDAWSE